MGTVKSLFVKNCFGRYMGEVCRVLSIGPDIGPRLNITTVIPLSEEHIFVARFSK